MGLNVKTTNLRHGAKMEEKDDFQKYYHSLELHRFFYFLSALALSCVFLGDVFNSNYLKSVPVIVCTLILLFNFKFLKEFKRIRSLLKRR